jgi:hypothetical protein
VFGVGGLLHGLVTTGAALTVGIAHDIGAPPLPNAKSEPLQEAVGARRFAATRAHCFVWGFGFLSVLRRLAPLV